MRAKTKNTAKMFWEIVPFSCPIGPIPPHVTIILIEERSMASKGSLNF